MIIEDIYGKLEIVPDRPRLTKLDQLHALVEAGEDYLEAILSLCSDSDKDALMMGASCKEIVEKWYRLNE